MAKSRSITEKAYIEGYRAARIERRTHINSYEDHYRRWRRHGYGDVFAAARRHLWKRIDYEYHSAWWTKARARYEVWRERYRHGSTIPF